MSLYQFIVNPESGRKVNINGKIGRKVIEKYQIAGGEKCGWLCRKRKKASEMASKAKKNMNTLKIKKCGCKCQSEVPLLIKGLITPFIISWDCKNLYKKTKNSQKTFAEDLKKYYNIEITDKNGMPLKNLKCNDLIEQLIKQIKLEIDEKERIYLTLGNQGRMRLYKSDFKKIGMTYNQLLKIIDTFECNGKLKVEM